MQQPSEINWQTEEEVMAKIKFVSFTPREKKPKLRKHKKRPSKHEKRQKGL